MRARSDLSLDIIEIYIYDSFVWKITSVNIIVATMRYDGGRELALRVSFLFLHRFKNSRPFFFFFTFSYKLRTSRLSGINQRFVSWLHGHR